MKAYGLTENLTLTQAEIDACRPIAGEGGKSLRAFCPFHGSDRQRSLRVNAATGHFKCFSCGAWGYMAEARAERQPATPKHHRQPRPALLTAPTPRPAPAVQPVRPDLNELLCRYQAALPGSLGQQYLERRGISLELAQAYGLGYAAPGTWANGGRDWKWGRLVFPHTDPSGQVVNLYGRAVGADEKVPKRLRHDHLAGAKGYFNASAIVAETGPLFVCEGSFDALSLIAAGHRRAVAIFGVNGWRWEWVRHVSEIVLALDADERGQREWPALARAAVLRGKRVWFLPAQAYGGEKDASKAWEKGVLEVGEMPATPAGQDSVIDHTVSSATSGTAELNTPVGDVDGPAENSVGAHTIFPATPADDGQPGEAADTGVTAFPGTAALAGPCDTAGMNLGRRFGYPAIADLQVPAGIAGWRQACRGLDEQHFEALALAIVELEAAGLAVDQWERAA